MHVHITVFVLQHISFAVEQKQQAVQLLLFATECRKIWRQKKNKQVPPGRMELPLK